MAKKYPIGSMWVKEGLNDRATVRLEKRDKYAGEVWIWRWCHIDDSGLIFDWRTSKRGAVEECPGVKDKNGKYLRFKRVKCKEAPNER